MKRFAVAALAVAMLVPAVQAQAAPLNVHRAGIELVSDRHGPHRHESHRHKTLKKHEMRRDFERRHHWKRGYRYSEWKRHRALRDWHRHGLRRPGHGQHWIRVDNDYLLVGIASGVIASVVLGR